MMMNDDAAIYIYAVSGRGRNSGPLPAESYASPIWVQAGIIRLSLVSSIALREQIPRGSFLLRATTIL
jgi:hypothetical protein